MADVTRETILDALRAVRKNEGGKDVVSLNMISGVVVRDGNIGFAIEVAASEGPASEPLRQACESVVEAIPGVLSVTAVLTAERGAAAAPREGEAALPKVPRGRARVAFLNGWRYKRVAASRPSKTASSAVRGLAASPIMCSSTPRSLSLSDRSSTRV